MFVTSCSSCVSCILWFGFHKANHESHEPTRKRTRNKKRLKFSDNFVASWFSLHKANHESHETHEKRTRNRKALNSVILSLFVFDLFCGSLFPVKDKIDDSRRN